MQTVGSGTGVLVEDCEFVNLLTYIANPHTVFRRCRMAGPTVLGLEVASGSHSELWDCDILDVEIGMKTWSPGSTCEIHDSRIGGSVAALLLDQHTSAFVDRSTLTGGSNSVVFARDADSVTIHKCDFQRGAGPVVRSSRPGVWGAVTYDLTNNYWGTTSESDIQSWIIDSNDDPNICATVLYAPFAGQSVPAETTTWGDLKAIFR